MLTIKQLYRSSYDGEHIHTQTKWAGNQWNLQTEFIPNAISNTQISNRAVIIGNGESRKPYPIKLLANHRGGVLGAGAVQTYGCNALYRDFTPHFLVATGKEIVEEIAQTSYGEENIVYANAEHIQDYPGKFYLIPQDPHYNSGAIATYMACFDGHKQIYLLGFDGEAGERYNNNVYANTNGYADVDVGNPGKAWEMIMHGIMKLYSDVEFIRVMPGRTAPIPGAWDSLSNFRQILFKDFVTEIDL